MLGEGDIRIKDGMAKCLCLWTCVCLSGEIFVYSVMKCVYRLSRPNANKQNNLIC